MTYGNFYNNSIPNMENRVNQIQQRLNALNSNPYNSNPYSWNTQPSQFTLKGAMVTSIDEIRALPPSFDGSLSYYPTTDGKSIYVTKLAPDGTKEIIEYQVKPRVVEPVIKTEEPKNELLESLENRVNLMEENLKDRVTHIEEVLDSLTKKKEVKNAANVTTNAK